MRSKAKQAREHFRFKAAQKIAGGSFIAGSAKGFSFREMLKLAKSAEIHKRKSASRVQQGEKMWRGIALSASEAVQLLKAVGRVFNYRKLQFL
jgi:hypothetical protein